MSNTIFIDNQFHLDRLSDCYAGKSISDNSTVNDIPIVNGQMYVITSSGTSNGETWRVWGYKVCKLSDYPGNKEPMTYNDHKFAVLHDGRDLGYDGIMIKWHNTWMVMFGDEQTFICSENNFLFKNYIYD